jgi:hypothetical protein
VKAVFGKKSLYEILDALDLSVMPRCVCGLSQASEGDIFSEADAIYDSDSEVVGAPSVSVAEAAVSHAVEAVDEGEPTYKNALCENLIKKGNSGYYYAHMRALEGSTPAVVYDGTVRIQKHVSRSLPLPARCFQPPSSSSSIRQLSIVHFCASPAALGREGGC